MKTMSSDDVVESDELVLSDILESIEEQEDIYDMAIESVRNIHAN